MSKHGAPFSVKMISDGKLVDCSEDSSDCSAGGPVKQAESNKIWETQFSALQQLAQKNNPQACLFLATAYRFGKVIERNSETASQWRKKYLTLRKAALLKDDSCSMLEELVICLQKQSAIDANFTELLKKLQKNGSVTATELLKRIKNEP